MIYGSVTSLLAGHRRIGNRKVGLINILKTYSWKVYLECKLTLKHAPVFREETIIEITPLPVEEDHQKDARSDILKEELPF